VAPASEVETTIAEIWAQILASRLSGSTTSSSSLEATRCWPPVDFQDAGGVHVELSAQRLFEAPTVAQLAATIERHQAMRQARRTEDSRTEEMLKMVEQLSEEEVAALLSKAGPVVESEGQQCLKSPIA